MNKMDIKDYWNPSSPSYPKVRFVEKAASADDWEIEDDDEWEFDEDRWNCDEDGHFPRTNDAFTECGFCETKLARMRINDKNVFVDPDELVKLKKWNEMASGGGR